MFFVPFKLFNSKFTFLKNFVCSLLLEALLARQYTNKSLKYKDLLIFEFDSMKGDFLRSIIFLYLINHN